MRDGNKNEAIYLNAMGCFTKFTFAEQNFDKIFDCVEKVL